jgi:hypothetical protein
VVDELRQRLEPTPVVHSSIECVPLPLVPDDPPNLTGEDPTSKTIVHPIIKPVDTEPQMPPEPPMTTGNQLPGIPQPDKTFVGIENRLPLVPPTVSGSHYGGDISPEGTDNIVVVSGIASGSAERPAVIPESASSHWLPALREIKQHIEQSSEGRFERTSHLDQVRVPIRSQERVSYVFRLTFPRASHQIVFSFAAVLCASSCPAPPSPLLTLHLLSGF